MGIDVSIYRSSIGLFNLRKSTAKSPKTHFEKYKKNSKHSAGVDFCYRLFASFSVVIGVLLLAQMLLLLVNYVAHTNDNCFTCTDHISQNFPILSQSVYPIKVKWIFSEKCVPDSRLPHSFCSFDPPIVEQMLLTAGDIETNPGPSTFNFSLIALGSYHQGNCLLPQEARGRQCVPCCFMFLFIIKNSCPDSLTWRDLDNIIQAGSELYCSMSNYGDVYEDGLVDPEKLPDHLTFMGKSLFSEHIGVTSGLLSSNKEHSSSSLKDACLDTFKKCKDAIVVFRGISIAVHYNSCNFYIFDSHSRNKYGTDVPEGTSVCGKFQSVLHLCGHICKLANSVCAENLTTIQFDIHGFLLHSYPNRNKQPVRKIKLFHNSACQLSSNRQPLKKQKLVHTSMQPPASNVITLNVQPQSLCVPVAPPPITEEQRSDGQTSSRQKDMVSLFHHLVSSGPDYVCSCCTQTYFHHSVHQVSKIVSVSQAFMKLYLTNYYSVEQKEWLCETCLNAMKKGKIPKFWIQNGLKFPSVPPDLQVLSNLEERLVSPRLPFMQLREMPRGGQLNLKGNIVNVPADVNSTVKSLPRLIHDDETIMLKLKRKVSYKHHVAFENIRPNRVFLAAKWLVSNSTLFRNEGVTLNDSWLIQTQESAIANSPEHESSQNECVNNETEPDNWTEDESFNERLVGNLDTCLQAIDFREFNQVMSVAPAEKNTPLSIFQDIHSEILAFPSIFCGQARCENSSRSVPLHYSDVAKWELRNVDRRAAMNIPNIFFKLKRLQIKHVKDKVTLAIRKCKMNGQSITAGDLLTPGFVEKLTMQNDGYRVLRTLRGSPPYWEQAKRDVFAMIRQIGIPTWFCSFSAAETKWEPLLKSLFTFVNKRVPNLEEVRNLSWQEKCTLIKTDPVTCARYFYHRVQSFVNNVLKHSSMPIGKMTDFFYRVEFQQRGSPHIHMLIWIENAPIFEKSENQAITDFIDRYVTCKKNSTIPDLINYQTHRHASTCRKKGKDVCRFGFPIFPMLNTLILYPLKEEDKKAEYTKIVSDIGKLLNECHKNNELQMSFSDFLAKLALDHPSYLKAVRSTLTRPQVFLKRSVNETRINCYNNVLIRSWMANMDIQFILDPYSCVSYIVSYISKGQRGLSNLLRDACFEAKEHDSDIRQQVRRIGNQFLSSVEIGAQEAVFLVLQMPLRRCTRDVVYIDTKNIDDRTSLIKPHSKLKELPKTSKDVEMDNALKRYKRRPRSMENLCYADFVSWYNVCSPQKKAPAVEHLPEPLELDYELDHEDVDEEEMKITCGQEIIMPCRTVIKKRYVQKVLYTHFTPVSQNEEEHCRQKLMLYTHWRKEEDLLSTFSTYSESFQHKRNEINANCCQYERCSVDETIMNEDITHSLTNINSEIQHQEEIDHSQELTTSETFGCFDPGTRSSDDPNDYDIGEDICPNTRRISEEPPIREVSNEILYSQIKCLNTEQKSFFYHILHSVKTSLSPFYIFLSGGAGVGKSVVIRCLYQSLLKYLNHQRHEQPDTIKVLLCAPTGKAAHHIGGMTIHSAFCIPVSQGFNFKPLDMQQLNVLRSRYQNLRILIIDEISMVGRGMFNFINLRLQEITGCTKAFGGISILAVGDLYQLRPVADAWIFSQSYKTPQMSCLTINLWTQLFSLYELTQIMRQRSDLFFAELLNRLREGNHTQDDISCLRTRIVQQKNAIMHEIPHLFCTRDAVTCHNTSMLERMDSVNKISVNAIDEISGDVNSTLKPTLLERIPDDSKLTMGLQKVLVLGIGMPAEICLNIDTGDGLTNGASCVIRKFDFRVLGSARCSIIWVEFEDASVGIGWKTTYRHLYQDGIPLSWVPIMETNRKFTFKYFKTYLVNRRQFPLYLSAGKTIHKSQGSTMREAVLHFGFRKIDHIHYVGISRVTNLSHVHILELNENKICVSVEVQTEMERMRKDRKVKFAIPNLICVESQLKSIIFHNCRSLKKHFDNFTSEYNILCCDIIGLVETRLWEQNKQRYQINGFKMLCANSSSAPHGLVVYYKEKCNITCLGLFCEYGIEYALLSYSDQLIIGFLYCPPCFATITNLSDFMLSLSHHLSSYTSCNDTKVLIMGDFNIDTFQHTRLDIWPQSLQLKHLSTNITTDYGSSLDHIYTNMNEKDIVKYGTLESYYSDHKPLFFVFNAT